VLVEDQPGNEGPVSPNYRRYWAFASSWRIAGKSARPNVVEFFDTTGSPITITAGHIWNWARRSSRSGPDFVEVPA